MMFMTTTALDVAAAGLGILILHRYLTRDVTAPLPPGPRGLPLLGNILDMPSSKEWLTFAQWGRIWGGISSVRVMSRRLIIVNSADIMDELDKQGAVYSDRPILEMAGELVGYKDALFLLRYGPRFRSYRKRISMIIGPAPMEGHKRLLEHKTTHLLKRILANPNDLMAHLRTFAGGVILSLTYGIEVQETNDPYVKLIEDANVILNASTTPGAFIVDFFPFLRRLPEWLPGMGFVRTARVWAKETLKSVEAPFAFTEKQIASGMAPASFVSIHLENEALLSPEELFHIKWAANSIYSGGADTTVSTEYSFYLAMVLNPEAQRKAQAEIDAVVGNDRLPTLADRPYLPYVNAIVKEAYRWNTVIPMGVPHAAMEDGIINGYFIPKGSVIITNLWNMLHDREIYPDPFTFNPDRHIATAERPAQRDPRTICFGFGRRICPGMHLAEASLFSSIAMTLAVFDISKAVENGVEITPVHENTAGTISFPEAFKCSIKPRSKKAVALINDEYHL